MRLYTDKVVKIYRSRTVVKEVSVGVSQGEIVGLLGPNGAGKTTTFYMVVGIIKANSGKVYFESTCDADKQSAIFENKNAERPEGGEPWRLEITSFPMYRRSQMGVGYLAQEASVFRQMSVEDNIGSILEFRKDLTKEQQREKLESLLDEFRLQHIRKSKGIQLSGGERRRTEIARALANDPMFLLLDEPFAGVDPIAVQDIQDIVAHLRERNIGILITDHNVRETLAITDRAYLLYEGTVLHHGTPEEMAADPDVREKYLGRDFELRRAKTQQI
ncbi:MAG: LPS export ABC transporter ATP-binding protein [Bacteroidales bacterium]|jgi:lipopolysaccharide export system ATP-binding protein|nr:LPS export ABC transporter ATP-binding protein [Bacteroidales bacterium]